MDMDELPLMKKVLLTQRMTFAIDEELKRNLMELKYQYGVDISEWIRGMIRSELPKVRQARKRHS